MKLIRTRNVYACLGIYLAFHSTATFADHPTVAFGSEGIGAINTISAKALPVGSWVIGLRSEVINNDAFSTEQLENFAAVGLEGVHSIDKITNTSLSLSHGATENFSVSARLPYIKRENIRESELEGGVPEAHTHGDSSGVGDLLLFGQYRVRERAGLDVALLFGAKAPTGKTDVQDDDGVVFETEFQPGTGSWDVLFGASVTKGSGNFGFHANFLYNWTTEGSQFTEIGDALSYNAALTYRLESSHAAHDHSHDNSSESDGVKWDLSIELNGETRAKNEISNVSDENSGGTTIYVSPGVRVSSKSLSGFISYGIPVVQDHNGVQTDVDSRIVAGVAFAF